MIITAHFPRMARQRCPVCGTDEDKECVMVLLKDVDEEGWPVHLECIRLDMVTYSKDKYLIYQLFDPAIDIND